jgi:hypothetical protein
MRTVIVFLSILTFGCGTALAESGFSGRPITANAFGPTGYTLHQKEFAIGLGPIAFGITENVQVGTNLLLWAFQVYNADLKASVIKTDDRAVAVGLSAYRLSLDLVSGAWDDEAEFLALAPYAALSWRLTSNTMAHVGAQYAHFSADSDRDIDDAEASGSATGTSAFAGLEYSVSNRTKFVADGGYDETFDGARVSGAVLFGWESFRLKLGISYFTAGDGFTFPLVGLWWRFEG